MASLRAMTEGEAGRPRSILPPSPSDVLRFAQAATSPCGERIWRAQRRDCHKSFGELSPDCHARPVERSHR